MWRPTLASTGLRIRQFLPFFRGDLSLVHETKRKLSEKAPEVSRPLTRLRRVGFWERTDSEATVAREESVGAAEIN